MTAVTSRLVKRQLRWDFPFVYQMNYNCLPLWFGTMAISGSYPAVWITGVCALVWIFTSPIALLVALKGKRPMVAAISSFAIIFFVVLQYLSITAITDPNNITPVLWFWPIALLAACALWIMSLISTYRLFSANTKVLGCGKHVVVATADGPHG